MSAHATIAPSPRRMSYGARVRVIRWSLLIALVCGLEVIGRTVADPDFFRPPSAMVAALFDTVLADARIAPAILAVVWEIALAYGLAVFAGLALGLLVGTSSLGRLALFPVVLLLYAIPQVPLMPLVILMFGIGPAAKVAFGFTHGIFPVIVNVVAGMRNVHPLYLRGARSMGASRLDVIRYVVFPHMVPSLFVGLRLAMTLTLLGVILAELYVSTAGVGYFTKLFAEKFNPAPLFALIGVLAAIAIAFNGLVRIVERAVTPGKRDTP